MSEHAKHFRRWRYVVDWRSQVGMALQIVAVLAAICIITAVAVNFVKSDEALEEMSSQQVRNFLFKITSVQFVVNAITLAVLAIYLTHRFAGPAFVLDRAVRESLAGDHSRRIHLRDRDYMKPLAAAVEQLRARAAVQERLLTEVAGRLEEGDAEGARDLLRDASQAAEAAHKTGSEPAVDPAAATVQ